MDYRSVAQYKGRQVLLTLVNGFWYKAFILEATEQVVTFTELKGRQISVDPQQIAIIEEVKK